MNEYGDDEDDNYDGRLSVCLINIWCGFNTVYLTRYMNILRKCDICLEQYLPLFGTFLCKRMQTHQRPGSNRIYNRPEAPCPRVRTTCAAVLT